MLALVQHDDPRADLAHEVEVVLDQHDAQSRWLPREVDQDLSDQGALTASVRPAVGSSSSSTLGSSDSTMASSSACFCPCERWRACAAELLIQSRWRVHHLAGRLRQVERGEQAPERGPVRPRARDAQMVSATVKRFEDVGVLELAPARRTHAEYGGSRSMS